MKAADAIWIATALLHQEHPEAKDFAVADIIERTRLEGLSDGSPPITINAHVNQHCVANRRALPSRLRMLARGDELYTSALTLGEVLVKPLEQADQGLAQRIEDAITSSAVIVALDTAAALRFAQIRVDRSVRAPDAIQLACAAQARAD